MRMRTARPKKRQKASTMGFDEHEYGYGHERERERELDMGHMK